MERVKEIMIVATWDSATQKDVDKAADAISDLIIKFS